MRSVVHLLVIVSSLICFSQIHAQSWHARQLGAGNIWDLSTAGPNSIVAVGQDGNVSLSGDAGNSWTAMSLPVGLSSTSDIRKVSFSSVDDGIILVSNNIYITDDGGASWALRNPSSSSPISAIEQVTDWRTYVARGSSFYWTSNNGLSWSPSSPGSPSATILEISSLPTGAVLAVGANGAIRQRFGHSSSWHVRDFGTAPWLGSDIATFGTQTVLLVVGINGAARLSLNGGSNWVNLQTGTTQVLYGAWIKSPSEYIVAGGNGTLLKTTDSGQSWVSISPTGYTGSYYAIDGISLGGVASSAAGQLAIETLAGTAPATCPVVLQAQPPMIFRANDTIKWTSVANATAYDVKVGSFPAGSDYFSSTITDTFVPPPTQYYPVDDSVYVQVLPRNGVSVNTSCSEVALYTDTADPCFDLRVDTVVINSASGVWYNTTHLTGTYTITFTNVGQIATPVGTTALRLQGYQSTVPGTGGTYSGVGGSSHNITLQPGQTSSVTRTYTVDTSNYDYLVVHVSAFPQRNGDCNFANDTFNLRLRLGCDDSGAHNFGNYPFPGGSCETCTDGILNGDELGVDCGGQLCQPCGQLQAPTITYPATSYAFLNSNGCDGTYPGIISYRYHAQWSAVPDLTHYQLQVLDATADTLVADTTVSHTRRSMYKSFSSGYWAFDTISYRVRALRNGVSGPWSNPILLQLEPVNTSCPPPPTGCATLVDPNPTQVLYPADTIRWTSVPRAANYIVEVRSSSTGPVHWSRFVGGDTVLITPWNTHYVFPPGDSIYLSITPGNAAGSSTGCSSFVRYVAPYSPCWDAVPDSVTILSAQSAFGGSGISGSLQIHLENTGATSVPTSPYNSVGVSIYESEYPTLVVGHYIAGGGSAPQIGGLSAGQTYVHTTSYIMQDTAVNKYLIIVAKANGIAKLNECSVANDTIVVPLLQQCRQTTAHNYAPGGFPGGDCETCSDGVRNGDETWVDCGGALCQPCLQCPTPVSSYLLTSVHSQAELEAFVAAYPNCTELSRRITLEGADITDLTPFRQFRLSQEIAINNCPRLITLTGLDSLRRSKSITVTSCDSLMSASALGQIDTLYSVTLQNLDTLSVLPSLNQDSMWQIRYVSLPALTFMPSHHVRTAGLVSLRGTALDSLLALTGIATISSLDISSNAVLQHLGLRNDLAITTNISIRSNPNLTICSEPVICQSLTSNEILVNISGNGVGCSSLSQVAAGCGLTDLVPLDTASLSWSIAGHYFGYAVALDRTGSRMAVGLPYFDIDTTGAGAVMVYERLPSGNWAPLGDTIRGVHYYDRMGDNMAFSADGSVLIVGSPTGSTSNPIGGRADIYQFDGMDWAPMGTPITHTRYDYFASDVAISGDGRRIAVGQKSGEGQPYNQGPPFNQGAVWIYEYNGSDWAVLGDTIYGTLSGDYLGSSVDISHDGQTVIAGAPYADPNGISSGLVRAYSFNGQTWQQKGADIPGLVPGGEFGFDVALDSSGHLMSVGAPYVGGPSQATGAAYSFQWNGHTWIPRGDSLLGLFRSNSGFNVGLSSKGDRLLISNSESQFLTEPGTAHIFDFNAAASNWTRGVLPLKGTEDGERYSLGLAISGDGSQVAVGAPSYDGIANDAGRVQTFSLVKPQSTTPSQRLALTHNAAVPVLANVVIATDATGCALAIGQPSAAGSNGHVVVLARTSAGLVPKGDTIMLGLSGRRFGESLALASNGDMLAVAYRATSNPQDTAVLVQAYAFDGDTWQAVADSIPAQRYGVMADTLNFNVSLALSKDGRQLYIGSPGHDGATGSNSGRIEHLSLQNKHWHNLSPVYEGQQAQETFGASINLVAHDSVLLVGAPLANAGGNTQAGKIYRHQLSGGTLTSGTTVIEGELTNQYIGEILSGAADTTLLAVGGFHTDAASAIYTAAQVYDIGTNPATAVGSKLLGIHAGDEYGKSLGLSKDGSRLLVGIPNYGTTPDSSWGKRQSAGRILNYVWDGADYLLSSASDAVGDSSFTARSLSFASGGQQLYISTRDTSGHWTLLQYNVLDTAAAESLLTCSPLLSLSAKLEGLLDTASHQLQTVVDIPLIEPYTTLGYQVENAGAVISDSIAAFNQARNDGVADWVLIELRSAADPSQVLASRAAVILRNGLIREAKDLTSLVRLPATAGDSAYVSLRHRNHLAVRSQTPVMLSAGGGALDFSDELNLYGTEPLKLVGGASVLYAGDANGDGVINAVDLNLSFRVQNGQSYQYGASSADFNGDGTVNAVDLNRFWRSNNSRQEQGMD